MFFSLICRGLGSCYADMSALYGGAYKEYVMGITLQLRRAERDLEDKSALLDVRTGPSCVRHLIFD